MSFRGLQTGVSGLQSQSKKMEVIGNNLANINTTGFKKGQVNFQELFHDTLKSASTGDGSLGGTNPMTVGSGVGVAAITNVHTQGSRMATGRTLDFMIEGDDFFVAQNGGDNSLMLSRNGSFQFDANMFLVDALGNKVQGFNVDPETQVSSAQAGSIQLNNAAIEPNATTMVDLEANIDSSVTEQIANTSSNAWELFSGGENFGSLDISVPGGQGSRQVYGSGYYQDSVIYSDATATMNNPTNTIVTLGAAPTGLADGFAVGDTVSLRQGANQVQRTITAIAGSAITLQTAAPASFVAGAMTITNLTDGTAERGSSGAAALHNDVLKSQITMVDQNGGLLASFYRVDGNAQQYTRATANIAGGGTMTAGVGEFTDMKELRTLMETVLRDTNLTNYTASTDLSVDLDMYGKVTLGGTGGVQGFRMVMNADNTEMLDRFTGIAMTDAGAVATTQARVDANGDVIAPPALGLGNRTVDASKNWYATAGLETYGYSATNESTGYGEYAGLRFDGGATGQGFGIVTVSIENALGTTVTQEFSMVARDADPNNNEFSTMGELAQMVQNTLRSADFSSLATNGALTADNSAAATFQNGRLSVSTNDGVFSNLTITANNNTADTGAGHTRSDAMNFGTVLGELSSGVSGKSGVSNKFIEADATVQAQVYDSQGNQHTVTNMFIKDRSSGLTNIEWKYKTGLAPNLNTFSADDLDDQTIYANTYNSVEDSATSRGVLAFDISSGAVLGSTSGSDARYQNTANLQFTAQTDSQEANESNITLDFAKLTSFNGQNTIIGTNVDGYAMGSLVRVVSEENTGNINGVYSNGKIRTLAKLGLMSISNAEGLHKIGSSYYSQTPNSSAGGIAKGLDQVFAVGAQAPDSADSVSSKIHGGSLEGSNVDLTNELTEMITTQRSFSASGKIITTSDDMLQEALNLKR